MDRLEAPKFNRLDQAEDNCISQLFERQLAQTAKIMDQGCGQGSHNQKLARLQNHFGGYPSASGSVLMTLNDYWEWFKYYAPGSEYDRSKRGAINKRGGLRNEPFRVGVIETAQTHLMKVTAVMADIVSMSLWLKDEQKQDDYIQPALNLITVTGMDHQQQTNPHLFYYGRIGGDEQFADTDMGVRIKAIHDHFETTDVNALEADQMAQLAAEAAVRSICAEIDYADRNNQIYRLSLGLSTPDESKITQHFGWEITPEASTS